MNFSAEQPFHLYSHHLEAIGLDEQERVPFPSKKGGTPEGPSPKNLDPKPLKDRMMDRMRKVDPKQSERYRQRTGE